MKNKSPFVVIEQFISPLLCEDIIQRLNHTIPNYDNNGVPLKTIKGNRLSELRIIPQLHEIMTDLENYYNFEYKGLLPFDFEWYPANHKKENPRCENSIFKGSEWFRINDYDFTGIIFLNDYQDKPPFDNDFEVYGGKLQFPNHNFGFVPKRGTLIIFPSGPNFVNYTSPVMIGDLNQIRFQIVGETPYTYDPLKFPGSYIEWFP